MLETDTLEKSLERVHNWIRNTDQKVSIFLGFQGVLIGLLFKDVFSWIWKNYFLLDCFLWSVLMISLGLLVYSLYESATTIAPQLKNHHKEKSPTYFHDIAGMKLEEYRKVIQNMDSDAYKQELINQIHISSGICAKKHFKLYRSITSFFASATLLVLVYFLF
jgi:hypothetical protein